MVLRRQTKGLAGWGVGGWGFERRRGLRGLRGLSEYWEGTWYESRDGQYVLIFSIWLIIKFQNPHSLSSTYPIHPSTHPPRIISANSPSFSSRTVPSRFFHILFFSPSSFHPLPSASFSFFALLSILSHRRCSLSNFENFKPSTFYSANFANKYKTSATPSPHFLVRPFPRSKTLATSGIGAGRRIVNGI